MRRRPVLLAACTVLMLAVPPVAAAEGPLLVSAAQLASRLEDPKLVLLHVGAKAAYDTAHIPGARYVDFMSLHTDADGLSLQMLPADQLRAKLSALGISDDSRVVVYQAGWYSHETRVILTLQYAGLAQVSLLDGGLVQWKREQRPVTTVVPPARTGSLSPLALKPIIASADQVRARLGQAGVAVVDGRASAFYDGVQTGGGHDGMHTTGHIVGALSVPFNTLTTVDGLMKPVAELKTIFERAGVKPGDTVIGYCHIGQQATAMLFAARLLGHPVLLYDGSFEDWSKRGLPVETSRPKR